MSEPTNEERAARIDEVMSAYRLALGGGAWDSDESDPQDLLTDLMHWCLRQGVDFDEILQSARMNYEAEVDVT